MPAYAQPLNFEERNLHQGATHRVLISHLDLTQTTANTAQSFTLLNLPANASIRVVKVQLAKAFKDASDNAFNTTTIKIGDGSDDDRLLPAIELNENGTEIFNNIPGTPTAATVGTDIASFSGTYVQAELNTLRTFVNALKADVAALRAAITSGVGFVYTSATDILLSVGSQSGKALNDIDNGEVHIFLHISDVTAPL